MHWHPLPAIVRKTFVALAGAVVVLLVLVATNNQSQRQVSTSDWLSAGFGSPTSTASAPPPDDSAAQTGQEPSASVLVQVVGAVVQPGVYHLAFGARVLDAIFAAGGFLPDADEASINLARPLNDGEQVAVQLLGDSSGGVSAGANTQTVNLNQADAATLDGLPGIGPTLAQRIIDYRQANGGFRSFDDLGKVAGIGASLLQKLKPLISL
jgi:competence protein ComEA